MDHIGIAKLRNLHHRYKFLTIEKKMRACIRVVVDDRVFVLSGKIRSWSQ